MKIIFIPHPCFIIRTVTKILILTQNITNCPKILFVFLVSFNIAAHNWLCFSLCVLFEHFICQHQERKIKLQIVLFFNEYELRIIVIL